MEKITTQIKSALDTVKVQSQLMALLPELEKGKIFECIIQDYHKKRSLNANDYFHLLVNKIAKATGKGDDETKKELNLEYGSIMRDENGNKVGIKLPASVDVNSIYKYAKWFDEREENGIKFNCFIIYKPTHTLDSKEMAFLIDKTIEEAQNLGIETATPTQIAEMKSLWEKQNAKKDK